VLVDTPPLLSPATSIAADINLSGSLSQSGKLSDCPVSASERENGTVNPVFLNAAKEVPVASSFQANLLNTQQQLRNACVNSMSGMVQSTGERRVSTPRITTQPPMPHREHYATMPLPQTSQSSQSSPNTLNLTHQGDKSEKDNKEKDNKEKDNKEKDNKEKESKRDRPQSPTRSPRVSQALQLQAGILAPLSTATVSSSRDRMEKDKSEKSERGDSRERRERGDSRERRERADSRERRESKETERRESKETERRESKETERTERPPERERRPSLPTSASVPLLNAHPETVTNATNVSPKRMKSSLPTLPVTISPTSPAKPATSFLKPPHASSKLGASSERRSEEGLLPLSASLSSSSLSSSQINNAQWMELSAGMEAVCFL
jgi:hypothetical protein